MVLGSDKAALHSAREQFKQNCIVTGEWSSVFRITFEIKFSRILKRSRPSPDWKFTGCEPEFAIGLDTLHHEEDELGFRLRDESLADCVAVV